MSDSLSNNKNRIVIIGGGFGGIFAAKKLSQYKKLSLDIELINKDNYFVFQPLLPEVAAGGITASDAVAPIRQLIDKIQFHQSEVIDINFDKKYVTVVQGTRRLPINVEYDHLVLAVGQSVDLTRFPGVSEHGLTIKNMADAFRLRNHVIECLENADVTKLPGVKKQLLTFVVAGAGFSGVETVGEIKEMIDRTLKYYRNISPKEINVYLIEFSDRILNEVSPELSKYAKKRLIKQGIEVLTGVGTRSATGQMIELTNGDQIETRTLVATIGNGPNKLVSQLPLQLKWGKIKVDQTMRVQGLDNVWALGDAALIPLNDKLGDDRKNYAPPTAQFAVREGTQLAQNIISEIEGEPLKPFTYKSKGALASLGTSKAIAEVYGMKLTGVLAWLLWRGFYLSFLPGMATRIRVLINWTLNAIVPRNTVQTQGKLDYSTKYKRYNKGDHVFEPGMLADGFYIVLEGAFEMGIIDPETGEKATTKITQGGHFGERALLGNGFRRSYVNALEESRVLWLPKEDFERLSENFPLMSEYMSKYDADDV